MSVSWGGRLAQYQASQVANAASSPPLGGPLPGAWAPPLPLPPAAPSWGPTAPGSVPAPLAQAWQLPMDGLASWWSRLGAWWQAWLPGEAPAGQPSWGGTPPSGPAGQLPGPGQAAPSADFVVSSFNLLGSSHTAPGGKHSGMASGPQRLEGALRLLHEEGVELVGFQEMQKDQAQAFLRRAGTRYGLYPGLEGGRLPTHNSLAWRKDRWDLVQAQTMEVPYFEGRPAKMPVVRLRHRESGQELWMINVHNPADTKEHPGQERHRDQAEALERAMVQRLRAQSGLPVLLVGDMNEREDAYRAFVQEGGMRASLEGQGGKPPRKMGIDWILATPGLSLFGHQKRQDALVRRTTDHPVVLSRARLGGVAASG